MGTIFLTSTIQLGGGDPDRQHADEALDISFLAHSFTITMSMEGI